MCERVRTESDLGRLVSDGAMLCQRRVRPVAHYPPHRSAGANLEIVLPMLTPTGTGLCMYGLGPFSESLPAHHIAPLRFPLFNGIPPDGER